MVVTQLNNSSSNSSTVPLNKTLGKDDFLRLFTSQLRYQDPLKPLESTEFTSQMAQFSSLEQLFNLNSGIERLIAFQQSLNNGFATSLIGKSVRTDSGVSGKITGVNFDNGITYLMLDNGQMVKLNEIKEIFS